MVDAVTAAFPKVAVVLDVGGMVDSSWFKENEKSRAYCLHGRLALKAGSL